MRAAASVIVIVTAAVVIAAGALIRALDHSEFSDIWLGMWWALQTVTTVGYGDIVPKHLSGRIVGAIVMLQGVAFVTVFTALITSIFVARAESGVQSLADLRGKRLALGSADSAQAAILPLHFLRDAGVDPGRDTKLLRFDLDVGKILTAARRRMNLCSQR